MRYVQFVREPGPDEQWGDVPPNTKASNMRHIVCSIQQAIQRRDYTNLRGLLESEFIFAPSASFHGGFVHERFYVSTVLEALYFHYPQFLSNCFFDTPFDYDAQNAIEHAIRKSIQSEENKEYFRRIDLDLHQDKGEYQHILDHDYSPDSPDNDLAPIL